VAAADSQRATLGGWMQRRCSEPPREPPPRPIAEDATHHGGLGIGFVAIPIQLLLAEDASSAGYVERHRYVVAEAPRLSRLRSPGLGRPVERALDRRVVVALLRVRPSFLRGYLLDRALQSSSRALLTVCSWIRWRDFFPQRRGTNAT
jgi:hypothetical protein